MTNLSFVALVLWLQGYPDRARERCHEALTFSEELSHPYTKALASFFAACLHQLLEDRQRAQEHAETAIMLSTEHGFTLISAAGTILRGWALATQGYEADGLAQLRQGLDAYRAMGTEFFLPYFLVLLAGASRTQGAVENGLTIMPEALDIVDKNGERFYEAELHRLKGELLLALSRENQIGAEACFQQGLAVARRQQAKSWELRAAMSLSRLWQQQGNRTEARELLAPVYGWFTEGFGTIDLQEAKTLLDELAKDRPLIP